MAIKLRITHECTVADVIAPAFRRLRLVLCSDRHWQCVFCATDIASSYATISLECLRIKPLGKHDAMSAKRVRSIDFGVHALRIVYAAFCGVIVCGR